MEKMFSPAKIEILKSHYLETEVLTNPKFTGWKDGEDPTPNPEINISFNPTDDANTIWFVNMDLSVTWPKKKNPPFRKARILVAGIFRLEKGIKTKTRDKHLTISAPSILYSGARDYLRTISSKSFFPEIILPAISFNGGELQLENEHKLKK